MLKVRENKLNDGILLALTGVFDHYSKTGLEAIIMGAQESGDKQVILDFSGVTGIDSITLGSLFLWYHNLQQHRVQLSIVNPHPRIRRVLEESRITELIPIRSIDLETV